MLVHKIYHLFGLIYYLCYFAIVGFFSQCLHDCDSSWKFDYQNEQLTVEERPNAIDNFFGKNIVNITALVGANGSGKTSVLEFLYEKLLFLLLLLN